MAEVFMGQIMLTGFGFAPKNFAMCDGRLMSVNQSSALFSLLGTQFGGDGRMTFALPDLRGRVPVGKGESQDPNWRPAHYPIGTAGGSEGVALNSDQVPAHLHAASGTANTGTNHLPNGGLYGTSASGNLYAPVKGNGQVTLAPQTLAAGGALPHGNMQPFRVVNFNIALFGIFPSRS
jgi:microcystin-dependent protein